VGIRKLWARRDHASSSKGTPPTRAQADPNPSADARYVNAYLRQARIVLGDDAVPTAAGATYDADLARSADRAARKHRAQGLFAQALGQGRPLEESVLETAAALLQMGEAHSARAIALGAGRLPDGERARRLATGLCAHHRRCMGFAWEELGQLSDQDLARFLPVPAVEVALSVGTDDTINRARTIADQRTQLSDPAVLDLVGRFLAVGDMATAQWLWEESERREQQNLDDKRRRTRRVLAGWFEPKGAAAPGGVPVGILDYRRPDEDGISRGVGDYLQTLAVLANLARFAQFSFTGAGDLSDLAGELQARVPPEVRRTDVTGGMSLVPVNRDISSADDLLPGTWTFVFGPHSRQLFNVRFDFPYHPNVRPIFLSFDIDQVEMLTPEAIAYLRRYGPVGCRSWATVYLLLSAGVDAFFTGCVTTTLDAVFPPRSPEQSQPTGVALVDLPRNAVAKGPRKQATLFSESSGELAGATLAEGVRLAQSRIEDYRHRFERIVTRQLDTYLSATAVGVPVKYVPRLEGDPRHDGLLDLRPESAELQSMRDGIRELLDGVVELIASGADEAAVYAQWRKMTEKLVQQARERMTAPVPDEDLEMDLAEALRVIRDESRRFGPHDSLDPGSVTDVALSLDQNLKRQLPVTVESLLANASGGVRLWITCRGLDEGYQRWFADAFPDVPMTFLPFDHIDYGDLRHLAKRITVTTMDRLLLPDVLCDVDRIVYVDIDALTVDDIGALGKTDLAGQPLAAVSRNISATRIWRIASGLLDAEKASELRRRLCARYAFDYPSLNAGVLVLDLARMRADNFTETYLPWVERYGLNDQDVLIAYVGPDRGSLDPRWNFRPFVEDQDDPGIIHYAHGGKPWYADLCPYQEEWQHYAERFHARAGSPPV
jgi:lipopolysaccharide biosynthesis glycosyltransferase